MTRRGYALVTREPVSARMLEDLHRGYGADAERLIRVRDARSSASYRPPASEIWSEAPGGVDLLCDKDLIRRTFPTLADDVETVLHIRRAGSISGQQLGQVMLDRIRSAGGRLVRGRLAAVAETSPFRLTIDRAEGVLEIKAERVVNAAGPYFGNVARMMGQDLPILYVYQQKVAFEDCEGAIPRDLPFTIDLDGQRLPWTDEEREILLEDEGAAHLLEPMPGAIHCRPDGAADGRWIKLGWAYNVRATNPSDDEPKDEQFPDIVLRGASRLHPALATYVGRLPRGARHYGGYYSMTVENWPLIGPAGAPGLFMAGAMSGFGTMAACATCAAWVAAAPVPPYAEALSLWRYDYPALMSDLRSGAGVCSDRRF